MANIHISGVHLYGEHASVIRDYREYHLEQAGDWALLERELSEIEAKLSDGDSLKLAVSELKKAAKSRRLERVKEVAKRFALDFSSAAFANLAGGALLALVGL